MHRIFSILSIASILILLHSCGKNGLTWEKYTSAEGGFIIMMPVNSAITEKVIVTPFGKQVTHFVSWKPSSMTIDKFKLFQVSFTNCPSRYLSDSFAMKRILDSSINLRVKDFTENEIEAQDISLNGYIGKAFIFDLPGYNTIAVVKQCIVNNKLYDLTVVLKRNYATNPEVHKFYNSFQVLR